MKKILSLLLVVAVIFMLGGCSGGEDKKTAETVCTIDMDYVVQTVTLSSEDDVVVLQKNEIKSSIPEMVALGYSEEAINDAVEQCKTDYNAIEGVSYSAYFQDDYLYETITIDYKNADFEALLSNGFIEQADGETPDYISLELTMEGFSQTGYVCE